MYRSLVAGAGISLALIASGCANHRDGVLTAGYTARAGNQASPGATAATAIAMRAERAWRRELAKRAVQSPGQEFDNLSLAELRVRLRREARAHHFDVVSANFLRPRQLASRIVVETSDYRGLAKATPAILKDIDPRRPVRNDAEGWRFEGFYFEARDRRSVPFLIVFNYWRGLSGGGQWARSERLFPFEHG
jgi:hypothetical protein